MLWVVVLSVSTVSARGLDQDPREFVQEVFAGVTATQHVLWVTGPVRAEVQEILGHDMGVLRVRYWGHQNRTAWVLEEIGKEKPITVGIVVRENKIERIKVLIYRESRGWEVSHAFFVDQFRGAALNADMGLDHPIDGISGATLSVRALTKLARLALYLHMHSDFANDAP